MKRIPLITAAVGVAVTLLALLIMPTAPRLGAASDGDPQLARRIHDIVGDNAEGYRGLSVALVEGGRTTTATVGDPAGGPLFEIGSVTKVLTGMLLADLAADGVVRPDDTLRSLLPDARFADSAVGDVTLAELASHRSGLPRLPADSLVTVAARSLAGLRGTNPYGEDADDVLTSLSTAKVGDTKGTVVYSNFGMAVLGQALAVRTGTPFPQLLTDRILRPLGMSGTLLTVEDDRAGLASGSTATGRAVEAWSGAGYAPAGVGPRSTATDLARLMTAMLSSTAPGLDAATPQFTDDDGSRIGYAWFTDAYGDREITWHNGGTGGFSAYVGFDRTSTQGVVVLGNTDRRVEWIGLRLLGAEPPAGYADAPANPYRAAVTVLVLVFSVSTVALLARTPIGRKSRWRSAPDRLRLVDAVLGAVAGLLFTHRIGEWLMIPPVLWALAAGLATAGTFAVVTRWRELPLIAGGPVWSRWLQTALSAAVSVLVLIAFR